jgi:uncharacterized damage-inducible protein DinB
MIAFWIMVSETKRIADQLQRSFTGEAWHGPALLELLAGVTARHAAARPVKSAHSIWELVLHISAWENAARSWMAGEIPALPELVDTPALDWPAVQKPTPAAWKRTIREITAVHNGLLKLVGKVDDSRLRDIVAGRNYSLYFLLHGLVQHNLYHAGQIALLKKA